MVVYLGFFNGELTYPGAMASSAPEIISLFQNFADNVNNKYGVYDEAQDDIRTSILTIGNIRDQISEYNRNPGFIIGNPNYIEVHYQGNLFKLRTLYDIVGWIFSVVGQVPSGATRENYYYPLMMIAYHFCRKLVPNREFLLPNGRPIVRGVADVWSVIWFNQINNNNQLVTRVVLGATLDNPTLNVKNDTKNFRKERLKVAHIFQDGITAPLQAAVPARQDFGHCAETYPLLFICSIAMNLHQIRASAEGIAAKAQDLYNASTPSIEPYLPVVNGIVDRRFKPPCENCKYLMETNGFRVLRFEVGFGQ